MSDTRTKDSDESGRLIIQLLESAGHQLLSYEIVPDDMRTIRDRIGSLCTASCGAILVTGGTGLARRDVTIEGASALFEKQLDGFGELFRMLSFEEIGPDAMLSRAAAGVRGSTVIFLMPGSPAAVRLAMDRLILPCLGHLAALISE